MKKLTLIALALILMLCSSAFAQGSTCESKGSAIIPHYETRIISGTNMYWSMINLSNISDSDVTVTVKLFDHTGVRATGPFLVFVGSSYDNTSQVVGNGVDPFVIPAGETRQLSVYNNTRFLMGYGTIDWCSDNARQAKALVGSVRSYALEGTTRSYGSEAFLNAGQPF